MNKNDLAEWRQRLDLAILRGKNLIVTREEMATLLDAISECLDLEEDHDNYDHHNEDCDRCDDMKVDLEDAQDELKDAEKRIAELEEEVGELEERIEELKQDLKDLADQS